MTPGNFEFKQFKLGHINFNPQSLPAIVRPRRIQARRAGQIRNSNCPWGGLTLKAIGYLTEIIRF